MTTRKYLSTSQETTLTSAMNSSQTTMVVNSAAGLLGSITPAAGETFTVVIDPDTSLEEIVDVVAPSSPGSNTLTIVRPIDGTAAIAHSAGAKVRHMAIGRDFREANVHQESNLTAHAATTSAQLASVISDETGTGSLVFNTNPTIVTPTIASFTNATHNHTNSAGGGTLTSAAVSDFTEAAQDAVGAMFSSNTESGISVTYDDATNKVNFDVNDPVISLDGDVAGSATMTDLGNVTINTAISPGVIVNADISGIAAIAASKISGTAVTQADTGTVTSTMIADGAIVNADINASAQVAYGKLNLTNSITNADINASAAIDWSKIAPSATVSTTELGYLDGVTSAIQTQLDSKLATSTAASTYAPIASPALTGVPTAPTAAANTNTTQIATTAYVQTEINDLIAAAPGALDTLNELAAALGNDASFSTTVTNSLATKLNLSGGTMTGAIAMGNNKITNLGTPTASTDAATKNYVDTVTVAPSNLTGPITSVGNVTSVAAQTGTGSTFVMQTSPTLTTPNIGVATATSINGTTIPSSKTLVATDSTQYVVPSQTGNSGKFLTTNGTTSSWGTAVAPADYSAKGVILVGTGAGTFTAQTIGTNGQYLQADSTQADGVKWATVDALPSQTGNSGKYLTTNGTTASWSTIVTDPTPSVFMLMGA